MTIEIVVSPEAIAQLQYIDEWWRANRPAAPELFLKEFGEAVENIRAVPEVGKLYRHPDVPGVRRVPLKKTRKHVYYVSDGQVAVILTVWNAVAGQGPDLIALGKPTAL